MELQASFRSNKVSELIKTDSNENGDVIVLGRDIHKFLEVNSNYTTWFKRMCDYGFEVNEDYIEFWSDSISGNAVEIAGTTQSMSARGFEINHYIKLDMAKQIAMIQRNDKGKQAREYFLHLEKLWNSPEKVMERALQFAKQQVKKAEERIFGLETKIDTLTHSGKTYTADEIAKEIGISAIKLNKELHAKDFQYKRNGTWLPYAKHADKGYVEIKQSEVNDRIVYHRKFTELGRQFVLELLDKESK